MTARHSLSLVSLAFAAGCIGINPSWEHAGESETSQGTTSDGDGRDWASSTGSETWSSTGTELDSSTGSNDDHGSDASTSSGPEMVTGAPGGSSGDGTSDGQTSGSDDGANGSDDGASGSDDGASGSDDGAAGSDDGAAGSDDGASGSDDGANGSDDGAATTCLELGLTTCQGEFGPYCADLSEDMLNCGGCGISCQAQLVGSTCSAGMCLCEGGGPWAACNGVCTNTNNNPTACGVTCVDCTAEYGPDAECHGGQCQAD